MRAKLAHGPEDDGWWMRAYGLAEQAMWIAERDDDQD
jgi:hypothetical protein